MCPSPELPAILLLVAAEAGAKPWVALRDAAGRIEVGRRAPMSVPQGTLCLVWPRLFPWTEPLLRMTAAVTAGGGTVLPLGTVLRKVGLRAPSHGGDLLDVFELGATGEAGEVVRRILVALADRLHDRLERPPEEPVVEAPHPEILVTLDELPARPGCYTFHAADGRALYVGKARFLSRRVIRHLGARAPEPEKSRALVRDATRLSWVETGTELEALLREQLEIERERPALNTHEGVHRRPRGAWRQASVLFVLPSVDSRAVEVCLVRGDGGFHWERAPRGPRVPLGLWRRLRRVLQGKAAGWGPGAPGVYLTAEQSKALVEITLGWLAREGDAASRIDLRHEMTGRVLRSRLRRLLGEDPSEGRVEVT